MVCGLKQLAIHTKDAYQIACHFHGAKGPPLSTAQNRSTIVAKLYPLYPAVLRQIGGEGCEGGEGRREGGEGRGGGGRMERRGEEGKGSREEKMGAKVGIASTTSNR